MDPPAYGVRRVQPEPGLRLRGLRKSFGEVVAVDGLDLDVPEGAICALLGPSGCGKTTTLRLIAGLERPDAGTIEIGGEVVSGDGRTVPAERRRIGMVFQDYALFPHMDVAANVGYALGRRPDRAKVEAALETVGLGGLGKRNPHELSGGQQQRVALARALVAEPRALLLDEPFSNLDAGLRARVREEVREILAEQKLTSVFVTHDQEEALSVADVVAVVNEGKVEQVGTPEDVYSRPSSRWVASFLGEIEVLPGRAEDGTIECELGQLPNREGHSRRGRRAGSAGVAGDRDDRAARPPQPEGNRRLPQLLRPRPAGRAASCPRAASSRCAGSASRPGTRGTT